MLAETQFGQWSRKMPAPFISYALRSPDSPLDSSSFPGNLKFVSNLRLQFDHPVTFFVGENGSGKSTLLEAIAVVAGLPIAGGGTNELGASHGLNEKSLLADALRVGFKRRPKDGYFLRADLQPHFASLLDQRQADPDFLDNPYKLYGGGQLHRLSHGEAFLAIMKNRFTRGLFLLDEPESALSPQRQLSLLTLIHELASHGHAQFIIATHSAILLTYPEAQIVSFDAGELNRICLTETSHYQITKGILQSPEAYWKHLRNHEDES